MAASAILNFRKNGILGYNDPDILSVYQRTNLK